MLERREAAAERRPDAPHLDESRRHERAPDLVGELAGRFRDILHVVAGDRVERVVQTVPVFQADRRDAALGRTLLNLAEPHQPVAVGKRERLEEHRVHRGEHGAVGADPQRERQDDRDGEPGTARQGA
jgi:hypothetical protein